MWEFPQAQSFIWQWQAYHSVTCVVMSPRARGDNCSLYDVRRTGHLLKICTQRAKASSIPGPKALSDTTWFGKMIWKYMHKKWIKIGIVWFPAYDNSSLLWRVGSVSKQIQKPLLCLSFKTTWRSYDVILMAFGSSSVNKNVSYKAPNTYHIKQGKVQIILHFVLFNVISLNVSLSQIFPFKFCYTTTGHAPCESRIFPYKWMLFYHLKQHLLSTA